MKIIISEVIFQQENFSFIVYNSDHDWMWRLDRSFDLYWVLATHSHDKNMCD